MDEQQAQPFDLSAFELEDTATLIVQNARGDDDLVYIKGQPVSIELFGSGSREAVKALAKAGRAATMRLQAVFRGKIDPRESEKAEEELVDKLVACTKQINNFPIPGGALALYSNPKLGYIKKQVIKFLDDDANFSKASSAVSRPTSAS